jgi:sugar phosphate isomerase/epimerase
MNIGSPDTANQYDVGVQSFTYREFDVQEMCRSLSGTGVSAVELCHEHVTPDTDDAVIDQICEQLASAGLDVCGYGVVAFSEDDEDAIRETLSLVDRLGGGYCSLEFSPDDEEIRTTLLSSAADFDLELAIHNHGPDSTHATVEDVASVLDATPDTRLGACVDTGHYFRSGQTPSDVITRLDDRVLALHLKDFIDETTEAVPGNGQLDIEELVSLLDEETSLSQPLIVEYEADPADPTPAVVEAVDAVERAMQR